MKTKLAVIVFLLIVLVIPMMAQAQDVEAGDVEVTSGGQVYQSYLAAPGDGGPYPGIILIHSFRGLEPGYRTMVDQLAAEGFVVLALGWQTFEQSPSDDTVKQLVQDGMTFLSDRDDVDAERIGLTGFCAGGRYTMLLLPQLDALRAGVAWYGFPYQGEPAPADLVGDLAAPMLVIHGTADNPSPIADIYRYATDLHNASADFELKVYSGEPHGFMLANGELRDDDTAQDAFREMADFFRRKLA
ncbi:MAG: dienelactone hydrolase family protein [Chloroflexi bacterium]|nr:dienelactone hydrolase family protein [Chloroflexota bacterium]